jgi:predicted enzyme related to lactoylglutathione lyase
MSISAGFISGVILLSTDPSRLAKFYRDVLGIPIEQEEHDRTHWGCELGDIHFAIHKANIEPGTTGGPFKIALTTWCMNEAVNKLQHHNVALLHPPENRGFGKIAAFLDPDGNRIELTELSQSWLQYLSERRREGHDLITQWKDRA